MRLAGRNRQKGSSLINAVVTVAILSIMSVVVMREYQNILRVRTEVASLKMVTDVRLATVGALTDSLRMYLAKGCSRAGYTSSGGYFYQHRIRGIEKFDNQYGYLSFPDIVIRSDYGGLISMERPETFRFEVPESVDSRGVLARAVTRCNAYSHDFGNRDDSGKFCFEFGSKESASEDEIGLRSVVKAEAGLVEVAVDLRDAVTGDKVECRDARNGWRSGARVKFVIYWSSKTKVHHYVETFYVAK